MRTTCALLATLIVPLGCVDGAPAVSSDAAVDSNGCGAARALRATNAQTTDVISTADNVTCSAEHSADVVRVRICLSPPNPSAAEDSGVTYCAVIDLAASALPSLATGAALTLDGEARFVFQSPSVYRVRPSDVTYTATAPSAAIVRAWLEKDCFCTPTSLAAAQRFTGALRLDPAPAGRLRGRITMTADGVMSPTTYLTEHVEFATGFDLAILPEAAP